MFRPFHVLDKEQLKVFSSLAHKAALLQSLEARLYRTERLKDQLKESGCQGEEVKNELERIVPSWNVATTSSSPEL